MRFPVTLVFLGGGAGAIVRELSMLMFGRYSDTFPVDIFTVNIIASLLLGLVAGLHRVNRASDGTVLLISTGFCGGMSTFSTFIFGAYSEGTMPGRFEFSLLYVVSSLVVGYCATWLGLHGATRLRRA